MGRAARRLLAIVATALTLSGCAAAPPSADPPTQRDPTPGAVEMAAVGDSITAGDSRDFAGGALGSRSWVSYAIGEDVEFTGGWAQWGAPVGMMANGVDEPFDADVVVILAGTNDAGWTPPEQIAADLVRLVDNTGVAEVVLSSVPPNDLAPDSSRQLNVLLEQTARDEGWTWVDAAAGLREDGAYAEGMSYDGVHPTEKGARELGEAIAPAVVAAAGGR